MTALIAVALWVLLAAAAGLAGWAAVYAAFAVGVATRRWLNRSIDTATTLPNPSRQETHL